MNTLFKKDIHEVSSNMIIPAVYTDPDTKVEIVIVVFDLPPDVKNIDFDIIEEDISQYLLVSYEWPQHLYNSDQLFTKEEKPIVPLLHPKVIAVDKALQTVRSNIEDAPVYRLRVLLPAKVKEDIQTWKKEYIKRKNGATTVFLEFHCVDTQYTTRHFEKSLKIE